MEQLVAARILHVIGVVFWIGGVAMVTTVLLPAIRELSNAEDRVEFFERIERRFAFQARFTTLLTGMSGFYMLHIMGAWGRYTQRSFWWLYLMTFTWVLFTVMLFILEPLVLRHKLHSMAQQMPKQAFSLIYRMHIVLLSLSLGAIAGAIAGSHGI